MRNDPSPAEQERSVLYTIGHSNRTLEVFFALLHAHGIKALVDVRSLPGSRKLPQFNAEALAERLPEQGISYFPCKELGGRRKTSPTSRNTGWHHSAFRGYADYMATPEFRAGLDNLFKLAARQPTAIMCAEAVPWRCHRNMIADAAVLLAQWEVRHIMTEKNANSHTPAAFAKMEGDYLIYPDPEQLDLV